MTFERDARSLVDIGEGINSLQGSTSTFKQEMDTVWGAGLGWARGCEPTAVIIII